MIKAVLLCALVCVGWCQQDDRDDGQYYPERYEVPYHDSNQLTQGYQQQAYQPQAARAPVYRSDPRQAAILSEARYLSADGKFGASYKQEDGVEFKEESEPDGTRRGQYSWVDPSGQRRTVSYTAGKHGFQASGDHLPQGPVGSPAQPQNQPAPQQAYRSAPEPQYRPAPQPQYQAAPEPEYRSAPQPQYRPAPQPQYRPAPQPQYRPAPQPQYQAQPQQEYRPAPQPQYRRTQQSEAPVDPNAGGYTITASF